MHDAHDPYRPIFRYNVYCYPQGHTSVHTDILIQLKSERSKYPCRLISVHLLLFLPQLFSSHHPSISSPSLPLLLSFFSFCYLLSPCHAHLCIIHLSTNELEPLTLSLLLSAAAVPYSSSIFLPLFFTQPFYCSLTGMQFLT